MLAEAIESALGQTYRRVEVVVVVDDGVGRMIRAEGGAGEGRFWGCG